MSKFPPNSNPDPKRHRSKILDESDRRVRARYSASSWSDPEEPTPPDPLNPEDLENKDLARLGLFFYLLPIVGFFPALWTLYRHQGSREQRATSRLAVTLAFGWLLGHIFLETGARSSELLTIPLLLISSVLTSGYFVVNIWLMVRLWQRRPLRLPGVSQVAEDIVGKHLS
jgi:hypothetical protein